MNLEPKTGESLPAWNNSTEYQGLTSDDFNSDLAEVETLVSQIEDLNGTWPAKLAAPEVAADPDFLKALWRFSAIFNKLYILSGNLRSFVSCELSLDALNAPAQKIQSRMQKLSARIGTSRTAFDLYLKRCGESTLQAYLGTPETLPEAFVWQEARKQKDMLLSVEQEKLLTQFGQFGLNAWGDLYDRISGSLKVKITGQADVGLAQALGMLREADEEVRKSAYLGIQEAWKAHEEAAAAILNNLAGYRLEEYRQRSHTRKLDFLDVPLIQSRIQRQTLDAMMTAIERQTQIVQRALRVMAKCYGKQRLDSWDLLAPAPQKAASVPYTYAQAIKMTTEAFGQVDAKMGDFVGMMLDRGWIDSRVLPNKRAGAFCTGFAKSRTPRVFQTFMGSYNETSTLAHELGHAWHSWVMRDLPLVQAGYPMTLAETASIFAENALADHVFESGDADTRFEVAFAEVSHAVALLANIPVRFEFEKNLYTQRAGGALSATELGDLMQASFSKWYGGELGNIERQFWMTKLHFSIAGVSFYNYPYTFGYLFSLGIYGQRDRLGAGFNQTYIDILRDTGRMTAEDLIQKHLGADIRAPEFWLQSLAVVDEKVARLERLVAH